MATVYFRWFSRDYKYIKSERKKKNANVTKH